MVESGVALPSQPRRENKANSGANMEATKDITVIDRIVLDLTDENII